MSRHGLYEDNDDNWAFICWRGRVASAIKGKRGQKFLRELLAALDALPEKRLIKGELQRPTGEVCAIGSVGRARGIDMTTFDPYDYDKLAALFDVANCLVQEVEWMNDEGGRKTDQERFNEVREWVVENLLLAPQKEGGL